MKRPYFVSPQESHEHSLQTLNALYEYDDFMLSLKVVGDLGCGTGHDLEWWATRTTRDGSDKPLNIKCIGIDRAPSLAVARKYTNIQYQSQNFETDLMRQRRTFDVLYCHDSFQFVINPLATLAMWHRCMSRDGMLILILPQTTNMDFRRQAFEQRDGCYFHWTLVSLIHVLAVSGFDCAGGFFRKNPTDPWLHAAVYRSELGPQDPTTTTWYTLADQGLLPDSAVASVNRHGFLRQQDLMLPWLDQSLMAYDGH